MFDDRMFDVLMIFMYIGCGIYCLYSYYMQKKADVLLDNKIFCPNNSDAKKCAKPEAYVTYMLPRILILGIGLIVFGGLIALEHYLGNSSTLVVFLLMSVPMALLIWYVVAQRKAVKLYWE